MSSIVPQTRGSWLGLTSHPQGLSTLYFTELWERFSYYGMRALLVLFIVAPVAQGGLGFSTPTAGSIYGTLWHGRLPSGIARRFHRGSHHRGETERADRRPDDRGRSLRARVAVGLDILRRLVLIAIGTGLFKPNISALVGALYDRNDTRRDAGFSLFYMGINVGAFFSPLVTGFLAQSETFKTWLSAAGFDPLQSWHWGFGAAGCRHDDLDGAFLRGTCGTSKIPISRPRKRRRLSGGRRSIWRSPRSDCWRLALVSDINGFRWLRWLFIILPLIGIVFGASRRDAAANRMAAIGIYFLAAMVFWAIFEQAGTTLTLFADTLTRNEFLGLPFPSAWFQSANPIFVILLTPLAARSG